MKKTFVYLLFFFILIALISACGGGIESTEQDTFLPESKSTPTSRPSPSLTYTATIVPTATITPTPTRQPITVDNVSRLEVVEEIGNLKTESLYAMALSPDGTLLAVGEFDDRSETTAAIHIYRTTEIGLIPLKTIEGAHEKTIRGLAFSPDSKYLASTSWDYTIRIWNLDDFSLAYELEGELSDSYQVSSAIEWYKDVFTLAYSPDGRYLASSMSGRQIKIWNTEDYSIKIEFPAHDRYVTALSFSPDSTQLLSGSADKKIKLWDIETGEELQLMSGHVGTVFEVGFFSDGKRAYSSGDSSIRVWDLSDGSLIDVLTGHEGYIYGVDLSPDETSFISVGIDGTLRVWAIDEKGTQAETAESPLILNMQPDYTYGLFSVAITPDGKYAYSFGFHARIYIWNLKNMPIEGHQAWVNTKRGLYQAQFIENNIFMTREWKNIYLFDIENTLEMITSQNVESAIAQGIAFNLNEEEKTLTLTDILTGKEIRKIENYNFSEGPLAISPNQDILAVANREFIYLIDIQNGSVLHKLEGHVNKKTLARTNISVFSLEFTPDSARLVSSGEDETIRVWDVATGEEIYIWYNRKSPVKAISHNSNLLALGQTGWVYAANAEDRISRVVVQNLSDGTEMFVLDDFPEDENRIIDIEFSIDDSMLLVTTNNYFTPPSTLYIYDVETQELLATYDDVNVVSFSPDATRLLAIGFEKIRVYEIPSP